MKEDKKKGRQERSAIHLNDARDVKKKEYRNNFFRHQRRRRHNSYQVTLNFPF